MSWLQGLNTRKNSQVQFKDWTQGREIESLGTNAGATTLPFQTWHRFKEAFAPELIERAVAHSPIKVQHVVDVFGGSGTTALSAQFLDVVSTSIEVNPFLADVIAAKTSRYDSGTLTRDLGLLVRHMKRAAGNLSRFSGCPATFIEPGVKGRHVFNSEVAERLACLLDAIDALRSDTHRRLFRVLLGGILPILSNVCISGKGRRYRKGWETRRIEPNRVIDEFIATSSRAITEIHGHALRRHPAACVINADSRVAISTIELCDLVVFSPPYPNSFDYTDVYNLELWMLGYLNESADNQILRRSTLSSHVQIKRNFDPPPKGSRRLTRVINQLRDQRDTLWSPWIPDMVGGYFADMGRILAGCASKLRTKGQVWMVVGDSQYAGVSIAVDKILMDLAPTWGLTPISREPFRSMRASAQQGGKEQLSETLVILAKD